MSHPITARMAHALRNRFQRVMLVEIDHPDGMARYWSGVGNIEWNGNTFTGAGVFGKVSPIRQTAEISIQDIVFSLAGVDSERVDGLSTAVRNRTASAWLACLDKNGNVVADPYELLSAEMDYQEYEVSDGGEAVISIHARSGFYTLERSLDEVYSTEDQQRTYPDDVGFDQLSELQNNQVIWKPL